jgi:hypothetical protein
MPTPPVQTTEFLSKLSSGFLEITVGTVVLVVLVILA